FRRRLRLPALRLQQVGRDVAGGVGDDFLLVFGVALPIRLLINECVGHDRPGMVVVWVTDPTVKSLLPALALVAAVMPDRPQRAAVPRQVGPLRWLHFHNDLARRRLVILGFAVIGLLVHLLLTGRRRRER